MSFVVCPFGAGQMPPQKVKPPSLMGGGGGLGCVTNWPWAGLPEKPSMRLHPRVKWETWLVWCPARLFSFQRSHLLTRQRTSRGGRWRLGDDKSTGLRRLGQISLRVGQIRNRPRSLSSPNPRSERVLDRRVRQALSAILLPSPFSGVLRLRQGRAGPRAAGFCGRAWGVLGFRGGIGGGKAEGQV